MAKWLIWTFNVLIELITQLEKIWLVHMCRGGPHVSLDSITERGIGDLTLAEGTYRM